jgi:hypothetical protein
MKRILYGLLIVSCAASPASAKTPRQSVVCSVVNDLKFEDPALIDDTLGGLSEYVATAKTIAALRGATIWLAADGSITRVPPTAATKRVDESILLIDKALRDLKFQSVPPAAGTVPGTQQYRATAETIRFLTGKRFWISGSGNVDFEGPREAGGFRLFGGRR